MATNTGAVIPVGGILHLNKLLILPLKLRYLQAVYVKASFIYSGYEILL